MNMIRLKTKEKKRFSISSERQTDPGNGRPRLNNHISLLLSLAPLVRPRDAVENKSGVQIVGFDLYLSTSFAQPALPPPCLVLAGIRGLPHSQPQFQQPILAQATLARHGWIRCLWYA